MTTWLIRKTGSDTNGGTSTAVRSTGTDGIVNTTAGLTKVTSITAAWTAGDVGHGISVGGVRRLISAITAGTTLTVTTSSGSAAVTSSAAFSAGMVGQAITGPGIAANTVITVFTDSSHITISANAGAGFGTGTATLYVMATTTGVTAMVTGSGKTWNVGGSWLTVGVVTGATTPVVSGDTIYVGAGVYREAPTLTLAPTSAVSFIADVDGTQTGDPGEVVMTCFLTNDTTAPSALPLFNNGSNVNFYSWQGFTLVAGTASQGIYTDAAGSHDWTFKDCTMLGPQSNNLITFNGSATQAINLLIDRCRILSQNASFAVGIIGLTLTKPLSADLNHNVVIQNSLLVGGGTCGAFRAATTGANTFKPGGVTIQGCTIYGMASTGSVDIADASFSTTFPCVVNNCLIIGQRGLTAASSGQITEDYNIISCLTPRTTVSTGTHSSVSAAAMISIGQEYYWGGPPVAPFSPTNTPNQLSPAVAFGAGISPSTYDMLNRPRPSGGASLNVAAGCLEIHDFATREASVVDSSTYAMKLTGPGDQEIVVPVDAVAQVISIRSRHDATHGDTNKPQAILLSNGEIGVATQTVTATQTSGNWETLTFSSITPTAKGWVTLRLISRAAAGAGIAYFDTVAVV